nr:hypothetical protein [Tanacetum cinerariifolium]
SIILDNLPTFNSAFRFEERLRSLETSFFEYRQTNPFVDAVSAIPADLSEMELKKIFIEKMEGNKSIHNDERMMIRKDPPLDQTGGLKDKKKEVSMHQLALHLAEEPVQTTCQMEEPPHLVFETGADD